MFAGLKHLHVENAALIKGEGHYWSRVLPLMPELQSLSLPKVSMISLFLTELFEALKLSTVVNLQINYEQNADSNARRMRPPAGGKYKYLQ